MQLHDGAMGTMLAAEVRGDETADDLCVRAPELVRAVHGDYLAAGANVIQTNSFLLGLRDSTRRRRALLDAAHDCASAATADSVAAIAATIGPHARDARDYWDELEYWLERGVPFVRIETLIDRAAALLAMDAWRDVAAGADCELLLGCTVAPSAGFAAGRWVGELSYESAADVHLGLNCCEGPVGLRPFAELLAEADPEFAWIDPSAGVAAYLEPTRWAESVRELIDGLPFRAVGGCCGSTPQHIAQLRELVKN